MPNERDVGVQVDLGVFIAHIAFCLACAAHGLHPWVHIWTLRRGSRASHRASALDYVLYISLITHTQPQLYEKSFTYA